MISALLLELITVRSLPGLYEAVSRVLASGGLQRAVICRFSEDGQALVVLYTSSPPPVPQGMRLLLERAAFTKSVVHARQPRKYIKRSDVLGYGPDPWASTLCRESAPEWVEIPVFAGEAAIGYIFAAPAADSRLPTIDVVALADASDALAHYWQLLIADCAKAELATVTQHLQDLDDMLSDAIHPVLEDSAPDFRPIYQAVVDRIQRLTGADGCDLSVLRDGHYRVVGVAGPLGAIGQNVDAGDPVLGESVTVRAMTTRATHFFFGKRSDALFARMLSTSNDPNTIERLRGIRSWAGFPVNVWGKVVGAISLCSSDWDFFMGWRRPALLAFAERLGAIASIEEVLDHLEGRLAAERQRQIESFDKLSQARLAAAYGELARVVVHNLATILTPIGLRLRGLRSAIGEGDTGASSALRTVEEQFDKLTQAMDTYRRARTAGTATVPINVGEVLQYTVDFWRPRATQLGLRIEVISPASAAIVNVSEVDLLMICSNVISNALNAMRNRQGVGNRLKLRTVLVGNSVQIIAEDDGKGMTASQLVKARGGQPFTTRPGEGSGLGLPYVLNTVRQYGGHVRIDSAEGKGTSVTIRLPEVRG